MAVGVIFHFLENLQGEFGIVLLPLRLWHAEHHQPHAWVQPRYAPRHLCV